MWFGLVSVLIGPEDRDALIHRVSLLRRNTMAAPFEKAIADYETLSATAASAGGAAPQGVHGDVMTIRYRDEEAIYIQAADDNVTVTFSTIFREETDRVFGKVFLSEFVDARRRAIQNAPQVMSRNDPPLELRAALSKEQLERSDVGYITFVMFPRHLTKQRREECVSHIQTFRDYFHYHIKAAKVGLQFLEGRRWEG